MHFNGNQDAACNWRGTERWLDELDWSGRQEFNEVRKEGWVVDKKSAGWTRVSPLLSFAYVRGEGHIVSTEPSIPGKISIKLTFGTPPPAFYDGQAGRGLHPHQALVGLRGTVVEAGPVNQYHRIIYPFPRSRCIPINTRTSRQRKEQKERTRMIIFVAYIFLHQLERFCKLSFLHHRPIHLAACARDHLCICVANLPPLPPDLERFIPVGGSSRGIINIHPSGWDFDSFHLRSPLTSVFRPFARREHYR